MKNLFKKIWNPTKEEVVNPNTPTPHSLEDQQPIRHEELYTDDSDIGYC